MSIEITEELARKFLAIRYEGCDPNPSVLDNCRWTLTAAATVLAPSLDKRPTRERFLHLLNSPDEDGWRLLGRQCSRFADLMEAAGFVRDDPAPVVPDEVTVTLDTHLLLHFIKDCPECGGDKDGVIHSDNGVGGYVGVPCPRCYDIRQAIAKATP